MLDEAARALLKMCQGLRLWRVGSVLKQGSVTSPWAHQALRSLEGTQVW